MTLSDIPHMLAWLFIYLGLSLVMVNVAFIAVQFITGFMLGFCQAFWREIRNAK